MSDRALALHQPATSAYDQYFVLPDSCRDSLEPALANERLRVDQPQDLLEAGQVLHFAASSALRPLRLRLASAVALPWNDAFGRGVVLVGTYEDELPGENLKRLQATADVTRLTSALRASRVSGTLEIQRQLTAALRTVLAADVSGAGTLGRLRSLVDTARVLLRSDAAYLALPEEPSAPTTTLRPSPRCTRPTSGSCAWSSGRASGGWRGGRGGWSAR